jgi:hypothetical protein
VSSVRISERATTRRFSILYLREIDWVGLPALKIIDYTHINRRMSSMSAGIKPTQGETSKNSSLPNSRRVYVDGEIAGRASAVSRRFIAASAPRPIVWRRDPDTSRRNSSATKSRAAARSFPRTSIIRKRADDHRPQLPREDQRQHRQLAVPLRSTKKSKRCAGPSSVAQTR